MDSSSFVSFDDIASVACRKASLANFDTEGARNDTSRSLCTSWALGRSWWLPMYQQISYRAVHKVAWKEMNSKASVICSSPSVRSFSV